MGAHICSWYNFIDNFVITQLALPQPNQSEERNFDLKQYRARLSEVQARRIQCWWILMQNHLLASSIWLRSFYDLHNFISFVFVWHFFLPVLCLTWHSLCANCTDVLVVNENRYLSQCQKNHTQNYAVCHIHDTRYSVYVFNALHFQRVLVQ